MKTDRRSLVRRYGAPYAELVRRYHANAWARQALAFWMEWPIMSARVPEKQHAELKRRLIDQFRWSGMTREELARALGHADTRRVNRLLNDSLSSSAVSIEAAFKVLQRRRKAG